MRAAVIKVVGWAAELAANASELVASRMILVMKLCWGMSWNSVGYSMLRVLKGISGQVSNSRSAELTFGIGTWTTEGRRWLLGEVMERETRALLSEVIEAG
jgi:hypothetical protein